MLQRSCNASELSFAFPPLAWMDALFTLDSRCLRETSSSVVLLLLFTRPSAATPVWNHLAPFLLFPLLLPPAQLFFTRSRPLGRPPSCPGSLFRLPLPFLCSLVRACSFLPPSPSRSTHCRPHPHPYPALSSIVLASGSFLCSRNHFVALPSALPSRRIDSCHRKGNLHPSNLASKQLQIPFSSRKGPSIRIPTFLLRCTRHISLLSIIARILLQTSRLRRIFGHRPHTLGTGLVAGNAENVRRRRSNCTLANLLSRAVRLAFLLGSWLVPCSVCTTTVSVIVPDRAHRHRFARTSSA